MSLSNLYGVKGLEKSSILIDQINFAAQAPDAGHGVAVRFLAALDVVEGWKVSTVQDRKFLLLSLRVYGAAIAPYQEEGIRVNS